MLLDSGYTFAPLTNEKHKASVSMTIYPEISSLSVSKERVSTFLSSDFLRVSIGESVRLPKSNLSAQNTLINLSSK